jgi:hypothetical protein
MAEAIPWTYLTGPELKSYRRKLSKKRKTFCDAECPPDCDGDHYELKEQPEELMFGE